MKGLMLRLVFTATLLHCLKGGASTTFQVINKCPYTVWPATLAGAGTPQLSSTGFELKSGASTSLNIPSQWSGRLWGRSFCSTDASGKFRCATGDCGSGQITCNGAGGAPPSSLIEFTLANGQTNLDFYDISFVDGFNLPLSVTPYGGPSHCNSTSCPVNLGSQCPAPLVLKGDSTGATIGCKSACEAFNTPQYCCTGAYGSSQTCPPTSYSQYFKSRCPQAYSYAFDDKSSTFTCTGGANYMITFCP